MSASHYISSAIIAALRPACLLWLLDVGVPVTLQSASRAVWIERVLEGHHYQTYGEREALQTLIFFVNGC